MNTPQIPATAEPAFSFSQLSMYEQCPQRWWWRYIGHWNGWRRDADYASQTAYKLGKLESYSSWVGKRTHEGVSSLIQNFEDPEIVISVLLSRMQTEFKKSRNIPPNQFGPAKDFRLREHYFGQFISLEDALASVEDNLLAFNYFCQTNPQANFIKKFAETIQYNRFFLIDSVDLNINSRYVNFELNDVLIKSVKYWAAPDFAIELEDKTLLIIDWKTGKKPRKHVKEASIQLLAYALFIKLKYPEVYERISYFDLYEVHIPDFFMTGGKYDKEIVSEQSEFYNNLILKAQFSYELYQEHIEKENVLFAPKSSIDKCKNCSFLEICEEGKKFQ